MFGISSDLDRDRAIRLRDNLLARFNRYGVASERIVLLGGLPIKAPRSPEPGPALDPFLKMVASAAGKRCNGVCRGRGLGDALCPAVGRHPQRRRPQDWVADSTGGYVEIAVTQASRVEQLAQLRRAAGTTRGVGGGQSGGLCKRGRQGLSRDVAGLLRER